MNESEMFEALRTITLSGKMTCPTKLSIGTTSETGFVHTDVLVIYDCAPKILDELKKEGFYFHMSENLGGLVVEKGADRK